MAIPTFPERTLESEDSPPTPSPFPEPVAEQNLIIGEDARSVQQQRFVVGKETTPGMWLVGGATGRTISLATVAYASLVVTLPMAVDRARKISFRVTYTPGVDGAYPILYPQVTRGEVPEVFTFVPAKAGSTLVQFVGPTNPPSFGRKSLGHFYENIFEPYAASLVAATPVTTEFTVVPDDDIYPSAITGIRFALRDSNAVTAGAISIWGTLE